MIWRVIVARAEVKKQERVRENSHALVYSRWLDALRDSTDFGELSRAELVEVERSG